MGKRKRTQTAPRVLRYLAMNKPSSKWQIAKALKKSYSNIHATIQLLEKARCIEVVERKPSEKNPKIKVEYYDLTFLGLIGALSHLFPTEIDQVARAKQHKWLIFKEWAALTRDPEVKKLLTASISAFAKRCWQTLFGYNLTKGIKEMADFIGPSESYRIWLGAYGYLKERDATNFALCLEPILMYGAVPSWINKPENENRPLIKLWRASIKIPSIRKFIEEQFKMEEVRHQNIKWFQKWLLKTES